MPEEILYERLGKPDDKKESVSRGKTEIRLYYGRYLTKRKNIKYRKEYKIVNGQLDSWKDL
jgi:hypothetical protein